MDNVVVSFDYNKNQVKMALSDTGKLSGLKANHNLSAISWILISVAILVGLGLIYFGAKKLLGKRLSLKTDTAGDPEVGAEYNAIADYKNQLDSSMRTN